ncbi:hypothetical protein N7466_001637 [Penicillium verhagenii]|uniref:uncharacterized protein n=1 Tax=Penicillium verhagenii TaxID=1562060 RepID=UPI002545632C|nr:uncharacterized protein N7466_001637 [Penicillium verhagenii]KAJ5938503.1 hypothetical protein N7466_001637 [Penicillium verhagenii]
MPPESGRQKRLHRGNTKRAVYTTAPSQHPKVIQLPVSHTDNNPHEINFGSTAVMCLSNSASSEITSETSEYRTPPSLSPSHAHVAVILNGSMF